MGGRVGTVMGSFLHLVDARAGDVKLERREDRRESG